MLEGNLLRNPNDPRNKNTPDSPQPKDEFVLKFVKRRPLVLTEPGPQTIRQSHLSR